MSANGGEYQDGFLAGTYLCELLEKNIFDEIKQLGIGGDRWSDKMVDELVDQGFLEPPEGGYFFPQTLVVPTETGRAKGLEEILTPGARVPESILLAWRYKNFEDIDATDSGEGTPILLPEAIEKRLEELDSAYHEYAQSRDQYNRSSALESTGGRRSSSTTGVPTEHERILVIKALIKPSLDALDHLIMELEQRHNGGPRLEDSTDKLDMLRQLHHALGELLRRAEAGKLGSDMGEGLATEAYDLCSRLKNAFRNDPLPYSLVTTIAMSAMIMGAPAVAAGISSGVLLKMVRAS